MNPCCQQCGAMNGASILRAKSGDGWLSLGKDCHYYGPTSGRYRMSELPEEYVDCPLVKVELDNVMVGKTPRCLCQHCKANARKLGQPPSDLRQLDFFDKLGGKP